MDTIQFWVHPRWTGIKYIHAYDTSTIRIVGFIPTPLRMDIKIHYVSAKYDWKKHEFSLVGLKIQ